MSVKIKIKEVYEVQNQYKAFYTGGTVQWSSDGNEMLCQNAGAINLVSVTDDAVEPVIFGDADESDVVYTFALSNDSQHVVSAHRSRRIRKLGFGHRQNCRRQRQEAAELRGPGHHVRVRGND